MSVHSWARAWRDDSHRGAYVTFLLYDIITSMSRDELRARIWIDPKRCFGKPCIRGHRIWVSLILDLLASGLSIDEVIEQYPELERADILACLAYGSEMARERYVDVPLEPV